MNENTVVIFFKVLLFGVRLCDSVKIDLLECGVDESLEVSRGEVEPNTYPWLGILYYYTNDELGEMRAVTTVALIHTEFVVGAAADIGAMPKHDFRANTRVLLGEGWAAGGRRVRNYVIHPEYQQTYNTLALVQLRDRVRTGQIRPLCPPPDLLQDPEFFVVKFKDEYDDLQKEVIPVTHVPGEMCKDFYVSANVALQTGSRFFLDDIWQLYAKRMRPPHVVCAVSLETERVCVWEAGGALVARDVWGRWQLLGILVRGPGCGAPSRYLDMMSYYPWIHDALFKFQPLTISKLSNQKYVLRSSATAYSRFGACDPEEKINLVYREAIVLRTDNNQYQFLTYNMTIRDNVEFTCLTLELVNASASSEMSIHHYCPRYTGGPPCYTYKGSEFHISAYLIFSDTCTFEMFIWGFKKSMELIDILEWKWEEGTYYEDFSMSRAEYRGPSFMTSFGYEPLDKKMWVPEYDVWTTTEFDNSSWSSTTPLPDKDGADEEAETEPPWIVTQRTTKKTFKRRTALPWWWWWWGDSSRTTRRSRSAPL